MRGYIIPEPEGTVYRCIIIVRTYSGAFVTVINSQSLLQGLLLVLGLVNIISTCNDSDLRSDILDTGSQGQLEVLRVLYHASETIYYEFILGEKRSRLIYFIR